MKAYSLDLRQRILDYCDQGATHAQAAQRFGVSHDSVARYKRRRRETATIAPTIQTGRVPKITAQEAQEFKDLVASRTDWNLATLAQAWQERTGVKPSVSVLSETCKRFKITLKKRVASRAKETLPSEPPFKRQ